MRRGDVLKGHRRERGLYHSLSAASSSVGAAVMAFANRRH